MTIFASLHHVTAYRYDRPVTLGPQIIRLRPAPHCRTPVKSYALKVTPSNHFVNWQQDPFGNWMARFVFPEKVTEFRVEVDLIADMTVYNPFDFFIEEYAETLPFAYPTALAKELIPYLEREEGGALLDAFVEEVRPDDGAMTVDYLVALNQKVQGRVGYLIRMEPGVQTPDETLALASGSCRDSGWLLVQVLRRLGLAARFVSGYLIQLKPDVKALDGPTGTEVDFTDLHAWCEVYLPGAGWIGLDPTSGLLCGESHLPLCATPSPSSAAPITGGFSAEEGTKTEFEFDMRVTRVAEKPRVTLPFSDEAWAALDALGDRVDADLAAQDVRLTMGGEPTFISIDDYQGAEWNTSAVGPTKRARADELIRRLRTRFAPGGMLHYGQGKWYPGESLPRWTFSLYWRKDGKPIWRDPALVAVETQKGATIDEAQRFITTLADSLGVGAAYAEPAYEDAAHWLLKEGDLPENADPFDTKLEDAEARARFARVFERGLGKPSGYVLPIQRWQARGVRGWVSEKWRFRRGRLLLVPGDSPLGFRLPLASLPWVPPAAYPYVNPADPMAISGDLPDAETLHQLYRRSAARGAVAGPS